MITRVLETSVKASLGSFPVVGLVGARQVGKTTLARGLAKKDYAASIYLDLERPSDLAKLQEPELFLQRHAKSLVILDEVQRRPDLFPLIRSLVDEDRRPGRFLILGSASPDLVRTASESLAGRVVYHELCPLHLGEVGTGREDSLTLWCRGGFPRSYLASSEAESLKWRDAFVVAHLERDIPSLGIRVSPVLLRRFWMMLAHSHGQIWNATRIAAGLGVNYHTVRRYLDILRETFMARELSPYFANLGKRLVKNPKAYLRDSGLLHALLGLESVDDIMGHPVVGSSWEGWVIEQVLAMAPPSWRPWFYRTAAGAEVDLLLERPGAKEPLAIEIKFGTAPSVSKGFQTALSDLGCSRGFVICQARERFPLSRRIEAVPVGEIGNLVNEGGPQR